MRVTGSQNPQENGLPAPPVPEAPALFPVREGAGFYTLGDQLGSTSVVTDSNGNKVSEMRYSPWGEDRYTSGNLPTDRKYTGQREDTGIGLYYYNARWYDAKLGRFTRADTEVPSGIQGYDRYAYVKNSPIRFKDPSGHEACLNYEDWYLPVCREQREWMDRGVHFNGEGWDLESLGRVIQSLDDADRYIGNYDLTNRDLGLNQPGGLTIVNTSNTPDCKGQIACFVGGNTILINTNGFDARQPVTMRLLIIHELGHVIDYQAGQRRGYPGYYSEINPPTGWGLIPGNPGVNGWSWRYNGGSGYPTERSIQMDPLEDFADSFQESVDFHFGITPRYSTGTYAGPLDQERKNALKAAIYD